MSLARALALNTGVQLVGKIVSTALGVVIIGIMTRYLGQEGFGIYSTANAFLQVFALLMDLGLNVTFVALLGEHADDEAYQTRCVSALLTLRIVMAVVVIGLLAPVAALAMPTYGWLQKMAIIVLAGSYIFPSITQIMTGVQQRHLKMHIGATGEIIGRVTLLVGLILALIYHWGLLLVIGFVTLGSLGNLVFSFLQTRRYTRMRWNWDPVFWKQTLKRSWPVGVSIAFNLIYFKADTLILSLTRTIAEVGIYSAAYRVLEILITVPYMYAGILLPILSRYWIERRLQDFSQLLARSLDVTMLFILPLIMGTLILGTRMMTTVAGQAFAVSGDIIRILILAVGVIFLNVMFAHAVVAIDAQRKMIPIYIVTALVTLAGYILFIPTYGMWAAAWLTVLSETCVGIGSYLVTRLHVSIRLEPRTVFAAFASSLLMGLLIWPLRHASLALPLFVGIIVYAGSVYALGGVTKEMIQNVLAINASKRISLDSPLTPPQDE